MIKSISMAIWTVPKNRNFRIKTEPVTVGADATVCLHQTPDILFAVASATTMRMQWQMSGPDTRHTVCRCICSDCADATLNFCTRHMYTVKLHMLRMWQVPFLCENSDFFGHSVAAIKQSANQTGEGQTEKLLWAACNQAPSNIKRTFGKFQILREPLESFKY